MEPNNEWIGSVVHVLRLGGGGFFFLQFATVPKKTIRNDKNESGTWSEFDPAMVKRISYARIPTATNVALEESIDGATIRSVSHSAVTNTATIDAYRREMVRTDGRGNATTNAYDTLGRLASVTDTLGVMTSYAYDAVGNILGYRHYKPQVMCWLTEDPIGEEGGLNLYCFCRNGFFKYDAIGLYVNLVYDVERKMLTATDVDTSETLTLKTKVVSGNGKSCCVKADQWKSDIGPLPVGKYLVGLSYVPKQHLNDTGDYHWYRLYGDNGKGGYTYNNIPIKTPKGTTVYRGGFNLHTGRASDGCVTVWSDVKRGEKGYPHSDDYDKLKKLLDNTKPLKYKNSYYTGWLEVK